MKLDVRQHIIETASKLFYTNGYNLTGINEIIETAGIAKATLYHHFRSKEELCLAYLEYRHSTFMTDLDNYVRKKGKAKEQILAVFGFLRSFFKGKQFNGCWCLNTYAELPKDHVQVRQTIQQHKSEFLEYLQHLTKKNIPQPTSRSTRQLGRQIYLLYESAISESQLHQDIWPIREAEKMVKDLVT